MVVVWGRPEHSVLIFSNSPESYLPYQTLPLGPLRDTLLDAGGPWLFGIESGWMEGDGGGRVVVVDYEALASSAASTGEAPASCRLGPAAGGLV